MVEIPEAKLRVAGEHETREMIQVLYLLGPDVPQDIRCLVVQSFMQDRGFIPEAYRQLVVDGMQHGVKNTDETQYRAEYEAHKDKLTP